MSCGEERKSNGRWGEVTFLHFFGVEVGVHCRELRVLQRDSEWEGCCGRLSVADVACR